MLTTLISKALDFAKSEKAAKIFLKGVTGAFALYFHAELDPNTIAFIGSTYLLASAAIDAYWHKVNPEAKN